MNSRVLVFFGELTFATSTFNVVKPIPPYYLGGFEVVVGGGGGGVVVVGGGADVAVVSVTIVPVVSSVTGVPNLSVGGGGTASGAWSGQRFVGWVPSGNAACRTTFGALYRVL